jgi:hypothetical protein
LFIAAKKSNCGQYSALDLFQLLLHRLKIFTIKISSDFTLYKVPGKANMAGRGLLGGRIYLVK